MDQTQFDSFIKDVEKAKIDFGEDNVINMDETMWLVTQPPRKTLSIVGSDEVKGTIEANLKSGFTAIATITMSGKKYPFTLLAKGKKDSTNKKNYLIPNYDNIIIPSISGWSTLQALKEYITWLISYRGSDEFALVLDQYPTHKTFAEELKKNNCPIRFIFVPANSTDILQPLDRKVFGALKSKGRKKWNDTFISKSFKPPTLKESIENLNQSWDEITENLVKSSWEINNQFENDEYEEEDSNFELTSDIPSEI